jgi:hypothetical protein
MKTTRALEIINFLADGINPHTGEVFPDGVYQHPDTVRALHKAKEALVRMVKSETRQRDLPENAGKSWSVEEEEKLVSAFDAGAGIKDLAEDHKRTKGAIQSRLVKLGKIKQSIN